MVPSRRCLRHHHHHTQYPACSYVYIVYPVWTKFCRHLVLPLHEPSISTVSGLIVYSLFFECLTARRCITHMNSKWSTHVYVSALNLIMNRFGNLIFMSVKPFSSVSRRGGSLCLNYLHNCLINAVCCTC